MPDWIKRVNKERAADLRADESVITASYFQVRGSAASQITFGMTRGIGRDVLGKGGLADVAAARAASQANKAANEGLGAFEGSIASQFANDKGVLALTAGRLIVFGYSQGVFKTKILDVKADIERSDLVGWTIEHKKIMSVLSMAFSDGSDVSIEVPRANNPTKFATDLGIPEAS